jgi:flagellar basal-body rod modification protein FlgD
MVDGIRQTESGFDPLTLNGTSAAPAANAGQETKAEFLQLLVTQLKNQDPLNPIENNQFAVDLAQFSQLEQLIEINGKLNQESQVEAGGGSLASYLGHDVSYKSTSISISDGEAGELRYGLPDDASGVSVEIMNSSGEVVKTIELGPQSAGKQSVELSEMELADGNYDIKVKAQLSNGDILNPDTFLVGRVTGFVPGPSAALLVGDRELSLADIVEVRVAG